MQSCDSKLLSIHEATKGSVRNPLDGAREVGCFSVDAKECLHLDDRSQMKYYIRRDNKNLHLDLNVGYENDVRHLHDRVKIMNNLLRWIESSKFEPLHEHSIHFVCTRGVLKKLLNTPYTTECWTMCACRLDDVIYLNVVDPDDHFERQMAAPEFQKRCSAWGHKFEQYMTADSAGGIPDVTSVAHQVEKFYIIVKNTIGPYNLLISAETDGVDPSGCRPGSGDPSCYVEMKLARLQRDFKSINVFKRHKSRDSWSQAVCSGTEKIICGFRDEEGIVRDIKVYNTSDLPRLCENKWSPRVCINFCHNVLHYLRKRLTVNDPRAVYRCEYSGGTTISVSRERNPTGPFNLIPDWYEAELQKC